MAFVVYPKCFEHVSLNLFTILYTMYIVSVIAKTVMMFCESKYLAMCMSVGVTFGSGIFHVMLNGAACAVGMAANSGLFDARRTMIRTMATEFTTDRMGLM